MQARTLKIGQVAKAAGIGIDAVRFYERKGLIEEPRRRPSGYREYTPGVVLRLRFVKRAKELGFSLREIRELLSLKNEPRRGAAEVKRLANGKLADIKDKIATLQRMQEALEKLTRACSGRGSTIQCSILDALDEEEENT